MHVFGNVGGSQSAKPVAVFDPRAFLLWRNSANHCKVPFFNSLFFKKNSLKLEEIHFIITYDTKNIKSTHMRNHNRRRFSMFCLKNCQLYNLYTKISEKS